jgi:cadaverine:lysine antiporter
MSSAKKIGLFACTGVVAGNMMGSGIALLPANLASIGGIAIWGWVISIIGAMSLAYVYARLATKNPQQGGPIAYAGEISPAFGFQTGVFIIMQTGLVTWLSGLPQFLICLRSSPF